MNFAIIIKELSLENISAWSKSIGSKFGKNDYALGASDATYAMNNVLYLFSPFYYVDVIVTQAAMIVDFIRKLF